MKKSKTMYRVVASPISNYSYRTVLYTDEKWKLVKYVFKYILKGYLVTVRKGIPPMVW